MKWLTRWFSKSSPARPAAGPAAPAAAPPPPAAPGAAVEFLPWLLGSGPLQNTPLTPAELKAAASLDRVIAQPQLPDELLPRAASLIPQLLAMLRQTALPVPALAQQIQKDVALAAEVLRLASSPYYRAQGAVTDLQQAITLIGEAGLQSVIARVVLKPIFEAAPGPLSARAGARLWDHSETLAASAAQSAQAAGLPAFDGYLAGLLHDAGWTIALRVIDRAGIELALPPSADFAVKATRRAHRLFGLAAQRWNITPGFAAVAADALAHPLAQSELPLAVALRGAQAQALAELAAPAG